ncbi:MAG: NUDIX domain-containing protein, partial [Hyphomicrobiaceae bacterium]|nr:NUDIX domain-containing protein [Hyphomicrobiaceae bacterium]
PHRGDPAVELRVDRSDRLGPLNQLASDVAGLLMKRMRGRPTLSRAHAIARAAIRETTEETGLRLGSSADTALGALQFVARAVTPPGRVRRYDTRFFLADAGLVSGGALAGDGELSRLDWFTLDEIRGLELPAITRLVIEDVADVVGPALLRQAGVPYYYHARGRFQRDLL